MSSETGLTDRDEDALEAAGLEQSAEAADPVDGLQEGQEELFDLLEETRREVAELRQENQRLEDRVDELEDDGDDRDGPSVNTTIEKFARMEERDRKDVLNSSDRRAAVLFEHWWDMARKVGSGEWVITTHRNSTRKNCPSELRIDFEKYAGEDLHWEEIYRAMRALAKLAGRLDVEDDVRVETDENGRKHVIGGAFEYHERTTPDGQQTYKLVKLVDENSLTLL